MPEPQHESFETLEQLETWLRANHAVRNELWVRIFKKASGVPTVTWDDCVLASLAWGWIDGQRRSFDDVSFLQRLTPRRARSVWSMKNRDHADRLITEGRMQAPGLAQIEAAQNDGRWAQAYAGSASMIMPEEFLEALRKNPGAERTFAKLNRSERYRIYHGLQAVKRAATRVRKITELVARLAGEDSSG